MKLLLTEKQKHIPPKFDPSIFDDEKDEPPKKKKKLPLSPDSPEPQDLKSVSVPYTEVSGEWFRKNNWHGNLKKWRDTSGKSTSTNLLEKSVIIFFLNDTFFRPHMA